MNKKQLNKMLRLADIKKPINESMSTSSFELIKSAHDNNTYAIVRENRTYYIKKSETKKTLTENDFDYLGGLANRTKNSFRSYENAVSRLNIMFNDINRVNNINESVDLVNFDYVLKEGVYVSINEDDLQEKKFVLKQPKPKVQTKPELKPEPEFDFDDESTEDEFDFGDEGDSEGGDDLDFDFGDEGDSEGESTEDDLDFDFGDEGDSEGESTEDEFDFGGEDDSEMEFDSSDEGGDSIKDIQRTTGKLGQQLRDTEDLTSDIQKWVAKSVISALNLDTMDDNDKDDVINAMESGGNSKDESRDIDFMSDEEDRGGEMDLDDDEELLLDDEGPGGFLGGDLMDEDSYMSEEDMEEGMSSWNKSDTETGMGWETNEDVSYMGVDNDVENMDNYRMNNPAPVKPKEREKVPVRPSKSPFSPPKRIRPGEEPKPKAEFDVDYMSEPSPSTEPAPTTAPPSTRPPRPTRPSKSPFSPPKRIRPGEEPKPKAGYDDDVTFE